MQLLSKSQQNGAARRTRRRAFKLASHTGEQSVCFDYGRLTEIVQPVIEWVYRNCIRTD